MAENQATEIEQMKKAQQEMREQMKEMMEMMKSLTKGKNSTYNP